MSFKKISFLLIGFALLAAISGPAKANYIADSGDSGDSGGVPGGGPIAGVCGTSTTIPYTCSPGDPVNETQSGGTATWYCDGYNGGAASGQCSIAYTPPVTNGVCGSTPGTCSVGIPVGVMDTSGTTTWTCDGYNGGGNASCSRADSSIGQPPEPTPPSPTNPLSVSGSATTTGGVTTPTVVTVGAGNFLGMTVYPSSAAGAAVTVPGGQVVVEQPLILRGVNTSGISAAAEPTTDCSGNKNVGAIRFNETNKTFEGCNGALWSPFTASVTSSGNINTPPPAVSSGTNVTNGYSIMPGGLILEWGQSVAGGNSGNTISLPYTLPNGCLSAVATDNATAANGDRVRVFVVRSCNQSTLALGAVNMDDNSASDNVNWIVIGN